MSGVDRWERAKELLDRALDLPPGQREAFLRTATGADGELFDEVWALIGRSEPEVDPLERPPATPRSPGGDRPDDPGPTDGAAPTLEGSMVGPYRLGPLLGRGGMGVVHEAERVDDVGGTVAVKLIKWGMDSTAVARRFERERRILARLVHPRIAHLLDGGVTASGRPWFVMERVRGVPITEFCARQGLPVEGRVRLFLQVLDAVAFAHRNLVVHRDLKPSNILVRDDGEVKLLDFGVAKVLDDAGETDATVTELGGRVLTPSYSSPEQLRGEPVSTATDIYSLGVVLYELVTGRRPFELDSASLAEVQRVVSRDPPTRPSAAASREENRSSKAAATGPGAPPRGRLDRDLDAILLKALRKEPDRRYESAGAFQEDLLRFLDHRPVGARRGTWSYRAERFLRRNRAGVAAAAVVAVVAAAAGGWSLRQTAEAERQAALAAQRVDDVRALVNTLLFEVHDAVATLPGSTGARKLILDRAHEHLDDVAASGPEDPRLLMELAGAYRRLGEVEGRPTGPSLGDLAAARESFREGLALARRAVAGDSTDLPRLRSLALLHERLAGALVFAGDIDEGVDHARHAQALYERIAAAWPDSARHQLTAVIGRINLSDYLGHPSFPNLGRADEAAEGYRAALARLDRPPLVGDSGYGVVRYRGLLDERLARMLRLGGDLEEALARYRSSLEVRTALHGAYPNDDDAWRDVGVTHQNLCTVLQGLGRFDDALAECDRARSMYEDRFRADSLNAQTLTDLASVHDAYQELHRNRGETAQALDHLARMAAWARRRLDRDPSALPARQALLDARVTRSLLLAGQGAPVVGLEETLALADALDREGHLDPDDAERVRELRSLAGG